MNESNYAKGMSTVESRVLKEISINFNLHGLQWGVHNSQSKIQYRNTSPIQPKVQGAHFYSILE
jgi:hypothetical protein